LSVKSAVVSAGWFTATSIVCLVILELAFRAIAGVPVLSLADWRRAADTNLTGISEYDPVVGWHTKAGVETKGMNTIDFGIRRNSETDTAIRKGGTLVVGDSFTAGSGVNDEQTWPADLERMTGQPVLNAAVGGWGIDQMILRVGQLLDATKPKTVILAIQDDGWVNALHAAMG
jgi:hypothetical protein